MYGLGTGSIAFNFLRCAGTESRLIDCVSVRHRSCSHAEDVGARCLIRTGTITFVAIDHTLVYLVFGIGLYRAARDSKFSLWSL